jgi:hypothetical protein
MYFHLFIFVISIILIIYCYLKYKYGFWILQPVYHLYDMHYILKDNQIINNTLPIENKYTDFLKIKTHVFDNLNTFYISKFIQLIQNHYLINENNIYQPNKTNILPYFYGHNNKSFISFYLTENILMNTSTNMDIVDSKYIGVITSRPLYITINIKNKPLILDVYYVDYLCVNDKYRKRGIAPKLIQTHHYQQRHLNKKIQISLFKREDELTGIIPLCIYKSYGFKSNNLFPQIKKLCPTIKIVSCNETNYYIFVDYLKNSWSLFNVFIISEYNNILELIKTKNIFIYALIEKGNIISMYFYRDSCTTFDSNKKNALSCFGSINTLHTTKKKALFIQGFELSLSELLHSEIYENIIIENISHNNILINSLLKHSTFFLKNPTAYFLYNYIHTTEHSNKTFVCC